MRPFDLIIFDCDGVLVDSEMLSGEVLLAALKAIGIVLDMQHFSRAFLGRSFPTVAATLRETSATALPADFEDNYRRKLLSVFEARLKPTAGIEDVLDTLACPACVATSSTPKRARRSLEICGLRDRFGEHVFTASEVQRGKPEPDLFLHAAARMAVPAERCLVIEDSLPGIAAAQAAGMEVWRYAGGAHFALPGMREATPPGVPILPSWGDFYRRAPALRGRRASCEA
ncbi:HAD family hydrolase [Roseitranquillus sediminis]|uniref:HAD family hydrolase n=1 Tax=Roseitranquillus sediminis TaxID=2809051 RepID=UPI001D0CA47D|nr:HAD family hydrolase [Roseitranquillus sediminis]MBM9593000.1 HAD family hydrolase [Roseitranquillus sediminis]